tara:strand:- start:757 stop:1137 length:381 start_codon:yes stop_codon:yes gene_type:complete
MAIITSLYGSSSVSKLIRDTDCDTTIEHDINGGATNVQKVFIDNTGNAGSAVYVFLYNVTSGVTVGTTKPQSVLYCPAAKTKTYVFPKNMVFGTGLSVAGSTNFAASAFSATSPGASVTVAFSISA